MRAKEFIIENKKDRRAKKYNIKPRNPMGTAPQTGAGAHKDKKKADKQGDVKHKGKQFDEGVAEGSLSEFAPGGNSSSSYYAVTANFVIDFVQQKEEETQDLIDSGWTKQDLEQSGHWQGQEADITYFAQVRDGFLKGLKSGFDAYLQGDTQLKDQLGEYWIDNGLSLNQNWKKIYGEPWGRDEYDESMMEATGDNKFDKMLKGITGKKPVAKQQKADTKQQARGAFDNMFGGGNPADKLGIRKKGVAEDTNIPFNQCPHCRGPIFHESLINEKQDACYHKVRSRYKVWPSAYASGALVQCRKKGAKNWGNKSKK